MSKIRWSAVLLIVLFSSGVAFAEFDKENLKVGVEYTNLEKKIPDARPITVTTNFFGGSGMGSYGDLGDVDVSLVLANIGYYISENLTPYIVFGGGSVEYEWKLLGDITFMGGSMTIPLFRHAFEENGFAYGFGVRGVILHLFEEFEEDEKWYNNIDINYDIRRINLQIDGDNTTTVLGMLSAPTQNDIDYGEWNVTLTAEKTFELNENAIIDSVTPYIGYRFTSADMDIQQKINISIGELSALTTLEYSLEGNLHSLVAGANARINDNWSLFVDGVFLQEEGIRTGIVYEF